MNRIIYLVIELKKGNNKATIFNEDGSIADDLCWINDVFAKFKKHEVIMKDNGFIAIKYYSECFAK